ncbi:MAG: pyruvate formate lyase family protein [SAR202 cluster bacterium]|nr:pyruvate formate lyase family protein [SAR202 cluster bacterium]MDP6713540.1 pyruvate formate lyase family protein [SAR202 cluster bacterium]
MQTVIRQIAASDVLELVTDSRIDHLRDMHWQKTHEAAVVQKPVTGSNEDTLTGHARDFAALLEASDPFIQPDELIVGTSLATPEDGDQIDLGEYDPHYPPGHAMLLARGLPGMRDAANARLQAETDPDSRDFLRAVEISYAAACRYVEKCARHAEDMASVESDLTRKAELERISANCDELASGVPTSFYSALQLLQFVRVFGGRGCIGRFDQWMYPFYQQDIDQNRITQEEAQELLECLFVKLNHFPTANQADNDTLRNISLAGQTPDGSDASNELTYMCIEASAKLMLPEPKINVRFFPGSPPDLVRACGQALAKGANTLAMFNDEVAVPSLVKLGIPLEEARDYCNDGCSELIMGGKGTIKFKVHDALPILIDLVFDSENKSYSTFDEVMDDYKSRLSLRMPEAPGPARPITFPFFAAGIEDCLAEASPAAARYAINGCILAQVGNASDGLAAIKKLVFDDGILTWDQLRDAMTADFEGHESLQLRLKNRTSKYGNDDDYVDSIVKDIAEYFCDGVHERSCNTEGSGGKWAPGFMSFGIHRKSSTPASPDGRSKGELTANSFSPSVGMDTSGPTAALRSVAKVDLTKASHGSVFDIALHSAIVKGDDAFEKFVVLLTSFLKMRSAATLQVNVIDRDTLLRARENPNLPEFRTLIVRVWGFSAVFVDLPSELQDHVIARTEHGSFQS